ncbi:hypothetical protein C8R43DRAFT_42917 [Mycena crocata]|nr:hypothetical protein C8R43DRAFT_42917 [Mycena crocata]
MAWTHKMPHSHALRCVLSSVQPRRHRLHDVSKSREQARFVSVCIVSFLLCFGFSQVRVYPDLLRNTTFPKIDFQRPPERGYKTGHLQRFHRSDSISFNPSDAIFGPGTSSLRSNTSITFNIQLHPFTFSFTAALGHLGRYSDCAYNPLARALLLTTYSTLQLC